MKKNVVKINEAKLKRIVAESVKKVLKESIYGYNNVEVLAEDLLDAFNYNSDTDSFDGLNQQQNNILNAVYAYLRTNNFESTGAFTRLDKNGNNLGNI